MQFFLRYWYVESFNRFLDALEDTIHTLDSSFAIKDTAKNIDKPLFQDYTTQGRIIGFLLRLGRILIGLLIYALASLAYLVFYIVWLLFPAICVLSILGSVIGTR